MDSMLIVYKSGTGFTKRYADWIAETVACQKIPFAKISDVDINDYDVIVYGAGIYAGRIKGLKKFKKKVSDLHGGEIVVFASGAAPYTDEIVSKIKEENFTDEELNHIEFFYFQSGLNYERMGLTDKILMKSYGTILKLKMNKSDTETGTIEALAKSYDYSSREQIKPVVDYLQQLLIK